MSTTTPFLVYVKTLAGDLLAVEVDGAMRPCDFTFRVYQLLEAPRPPMAFLRFLKAEAGKAEPEAKAEAKAKAEAEAEAEAEEKGEYRGAHSFPLHFEEGDVFYLLVQDPEVSVSFQWRDSAILNETGDDMNYMVMKMEDEHGMELMTEAFYIVYVRENTYYEETDEYYNEMRFTNVVYPEDNVLLVFNQAEHVRNATDRDWRNVTLRSGATAYPSPFFLAQRYFRSDWVPYLSDKIEEAWRDYLLEATGQEAPYPVRGEDEDEDEDEDEV